MKYSWLGPVSLGVIVLVLIFLLVEKCSSPTPDKRAWQHSIDSVTNVVLAATKMKAHADTVYDTTRLSYVEYRDRILRSGTATARDTATFKKADAVIAQCDTVRMIDTVLIHAEAKKDTLLEHPPAERRVVGYLEGDWSLAESRLLAKVGVQARILSFSYIVAGLEDVLPRNGQRNELRGVVGARINF